MNIRFTFTLLATVVLSGLAAVQSQTNHHEDVEVIEPPVGPLPEQRADVAKVSQEIIDRTNMFRKKQGRTPVTVDKELSRTANDFAAFMAEKDRYGHTADGKQPANRATKHGYDYCIVLENIAYAFSSRDFATEELMKNFVEGWKNSPGHRKNMLDPDVTQTGVSVARSSRTGYYYAVQMFGRPKSAAITFRITNQSGKDVTCAIGNQQFRLEPRYIRTHTRCRPAEVTFLPAKEGGTATRVKPANSDRYVIQSDKKGYVVNKE